MKKLLTLLLVLVMALSLAACGGGQTAETSEEPQEAEVAEETTEEEIDKSAPLHMELDGGVLDYTGYEYVGNGFYFSGEGDPSKTIVLNFDYTNKEDSPKNYSSDFWITAYQNGTELSWPNSYNPQAGPESLEKAYDTVLKGGTVTFGLAFVLEDNSPITVIARHNGGEEVSAPMELELESFQDTSFNLDRLYGVWNDEISGGVVTITSSRIQFQQGKSKSYQDNPELWTDDTTFHHRLNKLGGDLTISEQDGTLRMENETVRLVQQENWPESGDNTSSTSGPQTVALGETISLDFTELTFDQADIRDSIEFVHSSGSITHRQIIESPQDGTKFICLQGTVTNLNSTAIEPKNMKAKVILNGEYELEAKVAVVDAKASRVSSLEPLNQATILLEAGISDSMVDNISQTVWSFGFGEAFSYSGDLSASKYYYELPIQGG